MSYTLSRDGLDDLLAAIRRQGFRLVGPVIADGAICYGDISSTADLPVGWTEEQDAGSYRLRRRDDDALFGYTVGPQSPKKYLFPASATLWRAAPAEPENPERLAFIGVRACELRAIAIQDRVFLGGAHPDPLYAAKRADAFIVAVNCGQAASTCFCVSVNSGPRAESGHRFFAGLDPAYVCLRRKCDADPGLGYEMMRRFAVLATDMLGATRLQLLDVYGHGNR
jgi:sulfhydrogenase subunit beta (sulfur reductase)